jgi:hypothetical protein
MYILMSKMQNQNTTASEELGFEVRVDAPNDEAIDAITEALEAEGFDVLTESTSIAHFATKLACIFARTRFSAPVTRSWRAPHSHSLRKSA